MAETPCRLQSKQQAIQTVPTLKGPTEGLTVNVLLCLSGAAYGFLEEAKVAIKSTPHNGQLRI